MIIFEAELLYGGYNAEKCLTKLSKRSLVRDTKLSVETTKLKNYFIYLKMFTLSIFHLISTDMRIITIIYNINIYLDRYLTIK